VRAADGASVHRLGRAFSLPAHIAALVSIVTPTHRFPRHMGYMTKRDLVGSAGQTTPATIRAAYNIGVTEASSGKTSQQAAGFLNEHADPGADLTKFFDAYYPAGKGRTFAVVGPNVPSKATGEASLDCQYIMSIGGNGEAGVGAGRSRQ
jgi:hypothetical protein